jgi:hypothetical protein
VLGIADDRSAAATSGCNGQCVASINARWLGLDGGSVVAGDAPSRCMSTPCRPGRHIAGLHVAEGGVLALQVMIPLLLGDVSGWPSIPRSGHPPV